MLNALVLRPGELVTREELREKIWPAGTFVEFDQALNTAIKKIRQALSDSANNPRFIETIPRKGYRFIGPVEGREAASAFHSGNRRVALSAITLAALLTAVIVAVRLFRIGGAPELPLIPKPLTTLPGDESSPNFSPDGNQIVFAYHPQGIRKSDIYVKLVDASAPVRLTSDPADKHGPAWSPDGRLIAFIRSLSPERSALFLMPAIGGPERKLAEFYPTDWGPCESWQPAWHPNGRWIVIVDRASADKPFALVVVSTETGAKRNLTAPPANFFGDRDPAFSPDGYRLAFTRSRGSGIFELYVLDLADDLSPRGEPRRITLRNSYTGNPAWTPDGRTIVFCSGLHRTSNLWKIRAGSLGEHNSEPQRLTSLPEGSRMPTVSRQGRLAYVRSLNDVDIWRLPLSPTLGARSPINLISSTRQDHVPQYSPDGARIAFASDRSGSHEIWVCNSDGSNVVQLTSFGGSDYTSDPRWSPDGRWISFGSVVDGRKGVYLISSDGGMPQRLTPKFADVSPGGWSHDGRWIYYDAGLQVWKMHPDGTGAVQITRNGGRSALESLDGRYLYYLRPRVTTSSLWSMPVAGGEETRVLETVYAYNFAPVEGGLYFMPGERQPSVQFFDFATGRVNLVSMIPGMPAWGFSISPDRRSLLYAQYAFNNDLMVVDNFRP